MHSLSSSYSPSHSVRARNTKDMVIAAPSYSFTQKTTTVTYPWPTTITGLERIALSAQGDLQSVLSAYFARPISVAVVYSHTYWQKSPDAPPELLRLPNPAAIASASPETPIVQRRQVHLQCSGKIVCTATSTVRMMSPETAHLFLVEKYAIGQMFRRMEKMPAFDLVSVGIGRYADDEGLDSDRPSNMRDMSVQQLDGDEELWRRYKLTMTSFHCDIVEVFPERKMFIHGEAWLDNRITFGGFTSIPFQVGRKLDLDIIVHRSWFRSMGNAGALTLIGFLLMLGYELYCFARGRRW